MEREARRCHAATFEQDAHFVLVACRECRFGGVVRQAERGAGVRGDEATTVVHGDDRGERVIDGVALNRGGGCVEVAKVET